MIFNHDFYRVILCVVSFLWLLYQDCQLSGGICKKMRSIICHKNVKKSERSELIPTWKQVHLLDINVAQRGQMRNLSTNGKIWNFQNSIFPMKYYIYRIFYQTCVGSVCAESRSATLEFLFLKSRAHARASHFIK